MSVFVAHAAHNPDLEEMQRAMDNPGAEIPGAEEVARENVQAPLSNEGRGHTSERSNGARNGGRRRVRHNGLANEPHTANGAAQCRAARKRRAPPPAEHKPADTLKWVLEERPFMVECIRYHIRDDRLPLDERIAFAQERGYVVKRKNGRIILRIDDGPDFGVDRLEFRVSE